MIKSIVTRFVVGIALVAASIAWSGWAYLHTVADPHRAETVATAVLRDPEARLELATPLAEQLVEQAELEPSAQDPVRDAVVAVMADPRISSNLIAAIGSAHARSFGVDDPRPATIDGALLVAAVREHLAGASPELAARIPADLVGDLKVPEWELPFIAGLRTLAATTVEWLGAAAIGLLTFALLTGDRVYTLRRYGFWAIAAGLVWALGPRLVAWLARQFLPSVDATLAAGVGAATSSVTVAATVMVGTGVAALVGAQLLRAVPSLAPTSPNGVRRPRSSRSASSAPAGPVAVRPSTSVRTVAPPAVPYVPGYADPVDGTALMPRTDPVVTAPPRVAPTTVVPSVTPGTSDLADLVRALQPVTPPPAVDRDPWAAFAGPAVEPTTGRPLPPRPHADPSDPNGVSPAE